MWSLFIQVADVYSGFPAGERETDLPGVGDSYRDTPIVTSATIIKVPKSNQKAIYFKTEAFRSYRTVKANENPCHFRITIVNSFGA